MGTNYYFRRDDNRTRYFMGKEYALARRLEQYGSLVVTQTAVQDLVVMAPALERQRTLPTALDARALATLIEIGRIEDGCSEWQVAPTGRNKHGTSLCLLALALDVACWSDAMPITFVSEDRFEDWQDDDSWEENVSTTELIDVSPLSLANMLSYVRGSARLIPRPRLSRFTWHGITGTQLDILDTWTEVHRGSTVEGGPISTTSGVIAGAIDIVLQALGDAKLEMSSLSAYREILVEYAETGSQGKVCAAVQALLTVTEARSLATGADISSRSSGATIAKLYLPKTKENR